MTQSSNPFSQMNDMFKLFGKAPQFDRESVMAGHRRNMEAITEANKMAVEVMKSISQLQGQYVKQAFDDFSSMMKEFMGTAASKDKLEKHSSHIKNHVNKAFEHGTSIANTLAKSQKEIFSVVQDRMTEGAKEVHTAQQKAKSTKH